MLQPKQERLLAQLADYGSCLVAFSGGVDSAVVAAAAHRALGSHALAVTANSPSLPSGEVIAAQRLAQWIGMEHRVIATAEGMRPEYQRNDARRCFHCKDELYARLRSLADEAQMAVIANGTNADDLADFRPGLEAARQWSVCSPLADCDLSKEEVRAVARSWQLPVAEKPASPCLASRIAYGQEVTPERLRQVDAAEQYLRSLGFVPVRVRYHADDVARIEVLLEQLHRLTDPGIREELCRHFRALGFRLVTLDLEGFRSGSLNTLVPLEALQALRPLAEPRGG